MISPKAPGGVGGWLTLAIVGVAMLACVPGARAQSELGEKAREAGEQVAQAAGDAAVKARTVFEGDPWLWGNVVAGVIAVIALIVMKAHKPGFLGSPGRDVNGHPAWIWFACALLTLAMLPLGAAAAGFLPGMSSPLSALSGEAQLKQQVVLQGCTYGVGLVTCLLLARLLAAGAPGCGLGIDGKGAGRGVVAFAIVFPLVNLAAIAMVLIHTQVTGKPHDAVAHATLDTLLDNRSNPWAWGLAGLAIIAAPVFEEVLYRGFLQSALVRLTGRAWLSVIVAAAAFAAMHAVGSTGMAWYAVGAIFVLGVGMGAAFERTQSLAAPIVMHVLFNGANVALTVWGA